MYFNQIHLLSSLFPDLPVYIHTQPCLSVLSLFLTVSLSFCFASCLCVSLLLSICPHLSSYQSWSVLFIYSWICVLNWVIIDLAGSYRLLLELLIDTVLQEGGDSAPTSLSMLRFLFALSLNRLWASCLVCCEFICVASIPCFENTISWQSSAIYGAYHL